ncbi:MAG: SufS family cysteine desulfurase [Actinobacteria bacterium]|uniref:cysteine desulfurase n=2 Tax=freshwater metagenome TaxID=449393 RepID=A0A6J6W862_9ZZZZ|nr:SufS family cysteine desulfurase [Actinomycetota bacterium]MTA72009.1 SufS family cysteine desulfurase [Actinomycetota bacterium]MTB29085.1 SufS family cysteine desulfurase [Actinomycetota bacterium]
MTFSPKVVRKDFPIFERTIRDGKRLVYLDSGATSQKPLSAIEAESNFYKFHNAAVHRGAHQLAEEATDAYEGAREIVAQFLGSPGGADEIVFTKSATESLNLLAYAMSNAPAGNRFALTSADRIVVTEMEHHANLIPWQQLSARLGAELAWFKVTPDSRLDLSNINDVITTNTKVVSVTHQSNVLGTINPLEAIVARAHAVGAIVILDACQSAPHMKIDVKKLGVDFLAFSGHKALGPTGIGVLWGHMNLLDELPPFLFGGSMIETVTMTSATWAPVPQKFEAGVPNMAQAVGLGAALNYLSTLGMDNVHNHETELTGYLLKKMLEIPDVRIVGPTDTHMRGGTVSFTIKDIHPHDIGQYLDSQGVAVRTGHHCAWPLAKCMNVPATTRASLYVYNDEDDCDALVAAILGAQKYFGRF